MTVSGRFGFLELNDGFWIMGYDETRGVPPTPCGPDHRGEWVDNRFVIAADHTCTDDPPCWPGCHDIHCSACGTGTNPDPLDGAELRECFVPDRDYRSRQEYPGHRDIWGPLGDGYELCRGCLDVLEGVF